MGRPTLLTSVDRVREEGSWLFTVRDRHDATEEAILVPCAEGVEGWINRCTHEPQRLDTGRGVTIRDGEVVCPRHGSHFDACSGACADGPARDTELVGVELAVRHGDVFLIDDGLTFEHEGGIDDGESPSSSSHISF